MKKIPVAVLGATGAVGQWFIRLLEEHPWFSVEHLMASERSTGRLYGEVVHWLASQPLRQEIATKVVQPCLPARECPLVFSALDPSVAGEMELAYAERGAIVVSNARNYRMHPQVPLLVGEVNADHIDLALQQSFGLGRIVTNPNCSVMGLVLALKPIFDRFGLEEVHTVTMQAVSGAGYPGVASIDILDNVIPYISGEEEKIVTEPLKILGAFSEGGVVPAHFTLSAQCHRVPVSDGHVLAVKVRLSERAEAGDLVQAWEMFRGEPQRLRLPTAPLRPIHYFSETSAPQPKLHRHLDKGMGVSVGRLKQLTPRDFSFVVLSHNMVRGAAGAALLNAELLVRQQPEWFGMDFALSLASELGGQYEESKGGIPSKNPSYSGSCS